MVQTADVTRGLRQRAVRDYLHESLWFWPGLTVAGALVAGLALGHVRVPTDRFDSVLFVGDSGEVTSVLTGILSALITAVSIAFSLTLVALQTAAGQYSPRLLRNYLRDGAIQAVVSLLLGTTGFTLALLLASPTAGRDPAPRVGATLALLLALCCVVGIVFFIGHIAGNLRVEKLVRSVATETTGAAQRTFGPRRDADSEAEVVLDPALLPATPDGARCLHSPHAGYFQLADVPALLRVAEEAGVVVRLRPQRGEQVVRGSVLAVVWDVDVERADEDRADADRALTRAVSARLELGFERTLVQDVALGFRQLVDMAVKALSPAINDPYTAVQSLDRMASLLGVLALHPPGPQVARDAAGRVRVVVPGLDLDGYLALSLDQVRRYGAGEPAVLVRILHLLRDLVVVAPPGLLRTTSEHVDLVRQAAEARLDARDRATVHAAAAEVLGAAPAVGIPLQAAPHAAPCPEVL